MSRRFAEVLAPISFTDAASVTEPPISCEDLRWPWRHNAVPTNHITSCSAVNNETLRNTSEMSPVEWLNYHIAASFFPDSRVGRLVDVAAVLVWGTAPSESH